MAPKLAMKIMKAVKGLPKAKATSKKHVFPSKVFKKGMAAIKANAKVTTRVDALKGKDKGTAKGSKGAGVDDDSSVEEVPRDETGKAQSSDESEKEFNDKGQELRDVIKSRKFTKLFNKLPAATAEAWKELYHHDVNAMTDRCDIFVACKSMYKFINNVAIPSIQ